MNASELHRQLCEPFPAADVTFTVLLEKVVMRVTSSPVARMLYSMQSTSVAAMILAVIACGAETDASAQERSDGNLSVGLRISG